MSIVKFSPIALNFGYDFVLSIHFFGTTCILGYKAKRAQQGNLLIQVQARPMCKKMRKEGERAKADNCGDGLSREWLRREERVSM